jgi:hypothetical protein
MKFLFLGLFVFLSIHQTFAETKEEQRTWFGLFMRKKITTDYDLWAETQLRHDEAHQTMNQTLNRFGILKNLNEHHELGFLFAYAQSATAKEYRPTLQYVYKLNGELNSFSARNRLEGRDIEDNDANSMRFRSQIRWAHVLNPKYDLVVWDEPFMNLTHEQWTGNRFIERNRAFIGTKVKFENISFEVGYMNQYIPRETRNTSEHILTTYFFF